MASKSKSSKKKKELPTKYVSERKKMGVKNIVANRGTLKQALKDAGYSDAYAKNPHQFLKCKTTKEFLDVLIPPKDRAWHHQQLMRGMRVDSFIIPRNEFDEDELKATLKEAGCIFRSIQYTEKGTFCYFFTPDFTAKAKALDLIYKISGDFAAIKVDDVSDPLRRMTDAELAQGIKEKRNKLLKRD